MVKERDWFKEALLNLTLSPFSEEEKSFIRMMALSVSELLSTKERKLPFDKELFYFLNSIREVYGGTVVFEVVRKYLNQPEQISVREMQKLSKLVRKNHLIDKYLYLSLMAYATAFHLVNDFTLYSEVLERLDKEKYLTFYVYRLYKDLSTYMWKFYLSYKERLLSFLSREPEPIRSTFLFKYFSDFVHSEKELQAQAFVEELLMKEEKDYVKIKAEHSKEKRDDLASLIRERLQKEENLSALEKKLGVSRGYLRKFVKNQRNLSNKLLLRLAKELGIEV